MSLLFLSAVELRRRIASKEISPVELLDQPHAAAFALSVTDRSSP